MIPFNLLLSKKADVEVSPYLQYEGVVPLITGASLASLCGTSAYGNSINSSGGFLKFIRGGKELYLARQCFRNSISWNNLNTVNVINGSKIITISSKQYRIMLPTGGNGDPSSGAGGDWNELLYSVCVDRPANYDGPILAQLTSEYLFIGNGSNARSTLCRESHSSSSANCVRRGRDNLTYYTALPKSDNGTLVFWRPLLELVVE